MSISTAVKDHAFSRGAQPGSAWYPVARSDWGVLAPGGVGTAFSASNLSASASGGSLPTSTGAFKISWVTAIGESLPSVEATVAVTGATGSVTVSISGLTLDQTNAQPVIGWRIYSGNGSGNEVANITSAGLNGQALTTLTTQRGQVISYIPIATTSVQVNNYGTGSAAQVIDGSGIQLNAIPKVGANATADQQIKVPVAFNPSKLTQWERPNATADGAGLSLESVDIVAPLYPGTGQSVSAGTLIVINNTLWIASVGGTAGSAVPNFAGTTTLYGTVTDNTVTWMNLGRWHVATLRWANASGTAAQPAANEYDFFQP